jgi:ABC-type phosphate transport system substrate-binding protein
VLAVLLWTGFAGARDLAVVVNRASRVQDLAMPDLVKICKGQTSRWPDGKTVSLVIRDPSLPEMKVALERIYRMSKEQVRTLMASVNHSGGDRPIIVIADSNEDLVKRVESAPGAAGLVDVYSITSGVSVVKIDGKLPLEPGYALHGNTR